MQFLDNVSCLFRTSAPRFSVTFKIFKLQNSCFQFFLDCELLNPHSGYVKLSPISYNSCITWLLASNFHTWYFFLFTLLKSFILRSKRTIKQILIFVEAVVHRCSSKLRAFSFIKRENHLRCFLWNLWFFTESHFYTR